MYSIRHPLSLDPRFIEGKGKKTSGRATEEGISQPRMDRHVERTNQHSKITVWMRTIINRSEHTLRALDRPNIP